METIQLYNYNSLIYSICSIYNRFALYYILSKRITVLKILIFIRLYSDWTIYLLTRYIIQNTGFLVQR